MHLLKYITHHHTPSSIAKCRNIVVNRGWANLLIALKQAAQLRPRSIEDYLLKHGRRMYVYPREHPLCQRPIFDQAIIGKCFVTALDIAMSDPRYLYVEGVVYTRKPHRGNVHYIRHAWIYDRHHRVHLDPLARNTVVPSAYLGIILSPGNTDYVYRRHRDTTCTRYRAEHVACMEHSMYGDVALGWSPLTYMLIQNQ